MKTYPSLYELATSINNAWIESNAIDWSEAEQLVRECSQIEDLSTLPNIKAILKYADENDEWDSEIVARWTDEIILDLDSGDKYYLTREKGDYWEVIGILPSGREDWVAVVSTETVANALLVVLKEPNIDKSVPHN